MSLKLAEYIGTATRQARTQAGLCRQQVADAVGLPLPVYERLERGRLLPSVATLCRLARVLNTSVDVLVGRLFLFPVLEP
ncbi:helix-turn-helix domain-containing protein [Hyalangium versicolor]|uniref:helix-turn-helix domain-containing protein n=1 Tax=Hyalangium versicolor TaxID=2861190 RepID=UPI001CCE0CF2|nr:helix-turn-helix transcriptional regulator [Hyalangium versicolor]